MLTFDRFTLARCPVNLLSHIFRHFKIIGLLRPRLCNVWAQLITGDVVRCNIVQYCAMCNVQCQCAMCNVQCAMCNVQLAICNMQYAKCKMQNAICNMQYAIWCNVQYCAMCNIVQCTVLCSIVQYCAILCNIVQCVMSNVQYVICNIYVKLDLTQSNINA